MPNTITGHELKIFSEQAVMSAAPRLEFLSRFALPVKEYDGLSVGDVTKVAHVAVTKDAAAYNSSSNHYGTAGDSAITFKDITVTQPLKKTIPIPLNIAENRAKKAELIKGSIDAVLRAVNLRFWNLITAANYSAALTAQDAASFDWDDMETLRLAAISAELDDSNLFAVLAPAYYGRLLSAGPQVNISGGGQGDVLAKLLNLKGFTGVYESPTVTLSTPGGVGEKLKGFAADGRAIGLGMGYPVIAKDIPGTELYRTKAGDLPIQLYSYFDYTTRTEMLTVETNFDPAVLVANALIRIPSAT